MNTEIIDKVIDTIGQYIIDGVRKGGTLDNRTVGSYVSLINARAKCNTMQDATEMVQKIAREYGL